MRGFISPLQFNIYNLTERGANNWNAIESRYLDFFVQWFIYLTNQIDWILWEIFNLRETLEQVLLFFRETIGLYWCWQVITHISVSI